MLFCFIFLSNDWALPLCWNVISQILLWIGALPHVNSTNIINNELIAFFCI
ncbi:hypothetical protein EV11_1817 [Prochlorococcus sp. SS52]|nr:hypothetical protein EV10_1715 [Prochlorococcus marinus str. SS51]KGG34687.1 hypothetical protein EV11_1817 [Prochlorococcus sp. SS52]